MNFSQERQNPVQKFGGLAVVVVLHLLIVYALISGLARKAAHVVAPELVAEIIEPIKPPPPPPERPRPPTPKIAAPPPPFVPPPEVKVDVPPQKTITAVTNVAPETPVLPSPAPPVQAKPAPEPAPPAPPVRVAGINDLNSCKPEYPRSSMAAQETGVTRIEFVVGPNGELLQAKVKKSSGSSALDRAAVAGLSKCKFNPGTQDGVPVQSTFFVEYVWQIG